MKQSAASSRAALAVKSGHARTNPSGQAQLRPFHNTQKIRKQLHTLTNRKRRKKGRVLQLPLTRPKRRTRRLNHHGMYTGSACNIQTTRKKIPSHPTITRPSSYKKGGDTSNQTTLTAVVARNKSRNTKRLKSSIRHFAPIELTCDRQIHPENRQARQKMRWVLSATTLIVMYIRFRLAEYHNLSHTTRA